MKLIISSAACLTLCSLLASVQMVATAPAAAQTVAAPKGDVLFKQRCAMCHAVAGQGGKLGPDLAGVVGRKAGGTAFAYSPALKAAKISWNAATLDKYLTAPAKMVPGTRMAISLSNPVDRKAVISYLAATKK